MAIWLRPKPRATRSHFPEFRQPFPLFFSIHHILPISNVISSRSVLRSSAPPLLHCSTAGRYGRDINICRRPSKPCCCNTHATPQLSRGNSSSSSGEIGLSVLLQEPHLRLLFQNQGFHAIQCNPSALNSIITDACACIGFARPTICKSYASHLQASLRRSALPFYPSTLPHRRRIF